MDYKQLIEQLEKKIIQHRNIIVSTAVNEKNNGRGNFLSGTEEESLLQLTKINGYLKLFLKKLKNKDKVSNSDVTLVRKFEFVYNELLKEFSYYKAVS